MNEKKIFAVAARINGLLEETADRKASRDGVDRIVRIAFELRQNQEWYLALPQFGSAPANRPRIRSPRAGKRQIG